MMKNFLQNLKSYPNAKFKLNFSTFILAALLVLSATVAKATGLSGTYTIGSGGSYSSFNAAFSALSTNGVSGAVTFNVFSGTFCRSLMGEDARIVKSRRQSDDNCEFVPGKN